MKEYLSEDIIPGKLYDRTIMRRLMSYIMRYRLSALLSILMVFVTTLLFLLGPYIFGYAIDHGIVKGDKGMIIKMALLLFGVETFRVLLSIVQSYNIQTIGQKVMMDIRMEAFSHIQTLPVSFFDKNPVGRLVTRLTNDIAALGELFSAGIIVVIGDVFIIVGVIVTMFLLNIKLALVALCVFPILMIVAIFFSKRIKMAYREIKRKLARINSHLNENITGMKIIQLFNREEKNYEKFDSANKDYLEEQVRYIRYYALFQPALNIINALSIALILWYGALRYISQDLTLGILVAFFAYIQGIFDPIRDIVEKYNIFQGAMASAERVFGLMKEQPEKDYEKMTFGEGLTSREVKGKVEFKDVWFTYNSNDFVLKELSFRIESGQSLALVGATGSGKTSVVNVMTRLYEINRGEILLDNRNIRDIEKTQLRQIVGMISQDIFLFSGTIRDNISLFNSISDKRILGIIDELGLNPFISRMPQGLDTEVAERGSNLSVGERQFISFARILAYNPDILILDEAMSNIDPISEVLIQDAIKKITKNRTSIIISHRLSTILNCDHILVLDKGKKVEEGTHETLMRVQGLYSQLYKVYLKKEIV
ncbi:MAG: ABC transporter ATP-binding component [Candidatus Scalindua rubra]|uniref:Multidrug resistance-like ATP-binding protein MdlB n=1 Tax=Candidatus Scalindua rubra TaxID=1872076 RepID=A0A1E3X9A9_9BACT|nr:MAG: ABC transporter ATP-binding component [Candidatus Scalindua rubra]